MSCYTYIHRRADDGKVFYVGKGSIKRSKSSWGRNTWWARVKAKHGIVVELVAQWPSEREAFEHESFLIACFRGMGEPLVNMTDGGGGCVGAVRSAAAIDATARANRGRRRSDQGRENMRRAQIELAATPYGKARSAAFAELNRRAGSDNRNAKRIRCVDTGQMFLTLADAAVWAAGAAGKKPDYTNISNTIAGRQKTAYGYRWSFD